MFSLLSPIWIVSDRTVGHQASAAEAFSEGGFCISAGGAVGEEPARPATEPAMDSTASSDRQDVDCRERRASTKTGRSSRRLSPPAPRSMATQRLTKHNAAMVAAAVDLLKQRNADALLVLLEGSTDWKRISEMVSGCDKPVIVAVDSADDLIGAAEAGLKPLALNKEKAPLLERLQHALLEAAADELIRTNGEVVAVYSGFQQGRLDSISHLQLDERMRRLTSRDLQMLESRVPLQTIKAVVDLAAQIGREGREGKPVGTLFVIGDTRKVLEHSSDSGVDPFRGYNRKHRNLLDAKVQDDAKEIAQLDGAFIVNSDGVIERSRQMLEVSHEDLTMTKGLGARHWAAAAITRKTKAISVVVSQSTGTVRLYQNGHLVMRIEPMDKAVKWQEFAFEPPSAPQES